MPSKLTLRAFHLRAVRAQSRCPRLLQSWRTCPLCFAAGSSRCGRSGDLDRSAGRAMGPPPAWSCPPP
eukprot:110053-Pyramimonas_sp.AAC.1